MIEIDGKTHYSSRGVSSIANVGRNNMLSYLRKIKVFDKKNIPTDEYWDKRWFRCITKERNGIRTVTTYWNLTGVLGTVELIKAGIANKEINIAKRKKEYEDPPFHLVEDIDRRYLDICLKHGIDVGRAFSEDRRYIRRSKYNSIEKNEDILTLKEMKNEYLTKIKAKHYEKEDYTERRVQEHDVFDGTDIRDKG